MPDSIFRQSSSIDRRLDAVFNALSDKTRRALLARLRHREATVSELARPFRMSLPAVSKHLRVLRRARLIRQERSGRVRSCRLTPVGMKSAARWIAEYERFWQGQLDSLERFFNQPQVDQENKT